MDEFLQIELFDHLVVRLYQLFLVVSVAQAVNCIEIEHFYALLNLEFFEYRSSDSQVVFFGLCRVIEELKKVLSRINCTNTLVHSCGFELEKSGEQGRFHAKLGNGSHKEAAYEE